MSELIAFGMEQKFSSFITRYRENILKLVNTKVAQAIKCPYYVGVFESGECAAQIINNPQCNICELRQV